MVKRIAGKRNESLMIGICTLSLTLLLLVFLAGASDGASEALKYRYPQFKALFPGTEDQFWDPQVSWKNKYLDGDVEQGEAFLFSSTIFVGVTDGYHLFRTIRNIAFAFALALAIGLSREGMGWKQHISYGMFFLALFALGFYSTFGVLFMK